MNNVNVPDEWPRHKKIKKIVINSLQIMKVIEFFKESKMKKINKNEHAQYYCVLGPDSKKHTLKKLYKILYAKML